MSRNTMTDQHLGESLRRLPEARARDGFTAAVLARVDRLAAGEGGRVSPPAPARWLGGWPLAGALTAAVSVAAVTVAVLLALGAADPRPRDGAVLQAAAREAEEGAVPPGSGGARGTAVNPPAGEVGAAGREEIASPTGPDPRVSHGGAHQGGAAAAGAAEHGTDGAGAGGAAGAMRTAGRRPNAAADRQAPRAVERVAVVGPGAEPGVAGAEAAGVEAARDRAAAPPDSTLARSTTAAPAFAAPSTASPSPAETSYRLAAAGRPGAGVGDEAAERLARLRRERAELLAELTALRRAVPPPRPSELLLGGDESFELVLDLQAGGRSGREAPGGGYQPASVERPAPAPHRL
jgi:hypothetical protein